MKISDLNGKNVCILGYGKEGQAMLIALEHHAPGSEITIADKNEGIAEPKKKHWMQVGGGWLKNLDKFDVIIKSPGIPPQPEFAAVKDRMTSSTQIFLDSIAGSGATVIGVTGSKGKSTTSSLIFEILKAAGKDVSLIGNIGEPSISHLDEAKAGKVFVMEMSSAQLMDLTVSPHIAVITSFFPEHLDYHGDIKNYLEAKKHIARFQTTDDVIFYNASSKESAAIARESKGKRMSFSPDDCPVPITDTKLIGNHNRSNIAAATKVAEHLQIPGDVIVKAIQNFRGLPHRLQSLGVQGGIEWIDDAISTTPESAIAALDALGDRVSTIILGGQDRGNDFHDLVERIQGSGVQTVILFPGSGPRIRAILQEAKYGPKIFDAQSMEEAVKIAKRETNQPTNQSTTPIVLLSTASPSYNMFKNFEEKGDLFRAEILK